MKKITFLVFMFLINLSLLFCQVKNNLINNGGFEDEKGYKPCTEIGKEDENKGEWFICQNPNEKCDAAIMMQYRDDFDFHTGKYSYKIKIIEVCNGVIECVQMFQKGINFEKGTKYLITFWAKADKKNAKIESQILGIEDDTNWIKYVDKKWTIDTPCTWTKYSYEFTPSKNLENRRFLLDFGYKENKGAIFLIDDVSITKE